jgi:hypothetical protein
MTFEEFPDHVCGMETLEKEATDRSALINSIILSAFSRRVERGYQGATWSKVILSL